MSVESKIVLVVKILGGLVAVGLVVTFFFGERIALSLFGPPRVTLEERYADSGEAGATFDHRIWDDLLKRHVRDDGGVDYSGFASDRRMLEAYLGDLESAAFDRLPRDGKLALLINAYNAFTVKLVLDQGPEGSIREVRRRDRWEAERWVIGGRTLSLEGLENDELRGKFEEPRVHFAIVDAGRSSPPLRAEAYVAERIEEQLADQARRFHALERGLVLDLEGGRLKLSRIYQWYADDFEQVADSVVAFAARHAPALRAALEEGRTFEVDWLEFDWRLNQVLREAESD